MAIYQVQNFLKVHFFIVLLLHSKRRIPWHGFYFFLSPFLLEEEKIKSFPLITLGYGHSGLFGMADSVSISYSAVITNVLVRQPQGNQINILIPPLHYTTSCRHHLPHQVYGFYFRIWLARAARWRGYDRGWYIWTTGRRAAEKPASAARIFFFSFSSSEKLIKRVYTRTGTWVNSMRSNLSV